MKLIFFTLACFLATSHCRPQKHQIARNAKDTNIFDDEDFFLTAARNQPVAKPAAAPLRPPTEWELEQNRNAHYKFSTNIDDKISDQTQQRDEVRDGLKVEGSYSYSDGYVKRTVHYVADEKGYRVVNTEVVPLADGPVVNLEGTASVDAAAHGTSVSYKVQSVPAVGQKIVDQYVN